MSELAASEISRSRVQHVCSSDDLCVICALAFVTHILLNIQGTSKYIIINVLYSMAPQPLGGLGRLVIEAS